MKHSTLLKLLLSFLILGLPLTGCSEEKRINDKPEPINIITLSVSPNTLIRVIPRTIYGTNLEWFNNGNGFWDPTKKRLNKNLVSLLKDQNISLVRFPGGTLSDFYLWQDGIGTIDNRPERPHHTDPGSSINYFGSPELLRLCQSSGAKPLITVNASNNNPTMAADWVSYMNDSDNQQRQRDGFIQPQKVKYWEIGNELYLAGSEAEKSITMQPAQYAATYLKFAQKMRSVDPNIKLMAIGRAGSYSIPFGPYTNWNQIVLSKAGKEIDLLSVHNSYFPVLFETKKLATKDVYQAMWAAPLAVAQDLQDLNKLVKQHETKRTINLAVTEWGPFFAFNNPKFIDHVKTLGSAIYVARILQEFIKQPRLEVANYFKFTDQSFMGWVSYEKKPKIPYYAFSMYSNHFGSQLVQSKINSPVFNAKKIGLTTKKANIPVLNVIAATSEDKNTLYINIVSCSWETTYKIILDLGTFQPEINAKIHTLSATSPLAHNGRDLPTWWPIPYKELSTADPKKPVQIVTTDWKFSTEVEIPPHSIMTIELQRNKNKLYN